MKSGIVMSGVSSQIRKGMTNGREACMMIHHIKLILRYLMRYRPKRRLTAKVTIDTIAIFIRYG